MALAREDDLPPVGFLIRIAHVALFTGNKLARTVGARNSLVALGADRVDRGIVILSSGE